jgi:hypothetical protein
VLVLVPVPILTEADVLDQLQSSWQHLPPEAQAALQAAGVVLAALLGGLVLGGVVARALRARNFDAALRPPGSPPPDADRSLTPTAVGGLLVRLTVWAAGGCWLARHYGQPELAATLGRAIARAWIGAGVLVAALALASLLAHLLVACLQGSAKADGAAHRNGATPSPSTVAGIVSAGVYGLVVLLAFLVAADVFDWPLTRSSAQALWGIAQNLLIAGAALLIGGLGARWARDLATVEGTATPEKRAGQYTALGIVAATTVLAVAVLLSSAGLVLGLAALAVLGSLLWLVRGYLPDVAAGLQLRAHKVREVWFEQAPWQLAEVGVVHTQLMRGGEFYRLPNRQVLEASLRGVPAGAAAR